MTMTTEVAPARSRTLPGRPPVRARTRKTVPPPTSPNRFDGQGDEADRRSAVGAQGTSPSPEITRGRSVISAALAYSAEALQQPRTVSAIRGDIAAMKLTPSRLLSLLSLLGQANFEASYPDMMGYGICATKAETDVAPRYTTAAGDRVTFNHVRWAARAVSGATLSLMVDIPLRNRRELGTIMDHATGCPGYLPRAQQRALAKRLSRHIADALAGRPFNVEA